MFEMAERPLTLLVSDSQDPGRPPKLSGLCSEADLMELNPLVVSDWKVEDWDLVPDSFLLIVLKSLRVLCLPLVKLALSDSVWRLF